MSTEAPQSRQRKDTNRLTRFKETCAGLFLAPPVDVITLPRVDMTKLSPGENAHKTAIVIYHGMGQQVRWQTLAELVDTLRQSGRVQTVGTRLARFEDDQGEFILGRVDVVIDDSDGNPKEVHIYESYWAPITEGRVRLGDVVAFLKDAGIRGIRHAFRPFVRFIFGQPRTFRSTPFVALPLASVLAVFLALVSLNAAIAVVTVQSVIGWARAGDRAMVTLCVLGVEAIVLSYLLITLAVVAFRTRRRRDNPDYHINFFTQAMLKVLLGIVGAATVLAGVLVPWELARGAQSSIHLPFVVTATVWLAAAWLAARTRTVLVQYVGDVVAYVSAFQVSRYDEIRDKIQVAGRRPLCDLYQFGGYGNYLVVGHSLGSVVAYDALNAAITKDRWHPELKMRIVDRTRAFITFGSPLDKIAFIFRTQSKDGNVREALASQAQPLIDEPRRPRWINIFSPQDPISGSLDFFDHPTDRHRKVENLPDSQADLPLWAHTQYWRNRKLASAVLSECISENAVTQSAA